MNLAIKLALTGALSLPAAAQVTDTFQFCYCAAVAPCGNAEMDSGCTNSSGVGATLSASGTTSLLADDLVLTAENLPGPTPGSLNIGLLLMNDAQGAPFASLGGVLCIGAGVSRIGIDTSLGSEPLVFGSVVSAAASSGFGPVQVQAGETWYFQTWYRDVFSGGCSVANFTNGVGALFVP